jgi:hypothetical protein
MQDAILDRRRFLGGSVAAVGVGSLGLVVGSGTLALAEPKAPDALLAEIVDQLTNAAARMQAGPSGEAGRQVAASLRLLATWGRAHGLDESMKRQFRSGRRRLGEALITPPDLDAELTLRGWRLPPGVSDPASPAQLAGVLDGLERHGITRVWNDHAAAFEAAAQQLDRRARGVSLVSLSQVDECRGANLLAMELESQVFFACVFSAWFPEFCVIASAALLAWRWHMWANGC